MLIVGGVDRACLHACRGKQCIASQIMLLGRREKFAIKICCSGKREERIRVGEEGREERRGEREEGRGERGEGRGKREEGPGKREEGRGKREEGRGTREEGRGRRKEGTGKREKGRWRREEGRGKRERERGEECEVLLNQTPSQHSTKQEITAR